MIPERQKEENDLHEQRAREKMEREGVRKMMEAAGAALTIIPTSLPPPEVAVLREHVEFLKEALRRRDGFWEEIARKAQAEVDALRAALEAERTRGLSLRVAVARLLEYKAALEYAHSEEQGFQHHSEEEDAEFHKLIEYP